jgi:hypothetical protein
MAAESLRTPVSNSRSGTPTKPPIPSQRAGSGRLTPWSNCRSRLSCAPTCQHHTRTHCVECEWPYCTYHLIRMHIPLLAGARVFCFAAPACTPRPTTRHSDGSSWWMRRATSAEKGAVLPWQVQAALVAGDGALGNLPAAHGARSRILSRDQRIWPASCWGVRPHNKLDRPARRGGGRRTTHQAGPGLLRARRAPAGGERASHPPPERRNSHRAAPAAACRALHA